MDETHARWKMSDYTHGAVRLETDSENAVWLLKGDRIQQVLPVAERFKVDIRDIVAEPGTFAEP